MNKSVWILLSIFLLSLLSVNAFYCFQEFTNVSTACGGVGIPDFSSYNFYPTMRDGNYNTYNETGGEYAYNTYRIPAKANLKGLCGL